MNTKNLRKTNYAAVVTARRKHREEREHAAAGLRHALECEYRRAHGLSEGAPLPAADQELLKAAVSSAVEIDITTSRLVAGQARPASMKSLGFARSELRRCLRSLGMIGDSGELPADPNAPPPGATDEERRAWSQRYVANASAEGKSAAP